jgi:hypothetical protein
MLEVVILAFHVLSLIKVYQIINNSSITKEVCIFSGMKASDIMELQRKLELLQMQQRDDPSDSEEPSRVEPSAKQHLAHDQSIVFRNKNLTIDDFHVSTTLGNITLLGLKTFRYRNIWKSQTGQMEE